MKINNEDMELFKLIDFATSGNIKAKWEIIWRFNKLIIKSSCIKGKLDDNCQEFIENKVFNSIEKFQTLKNIKKYKKF